MFIFLLFSFFTICFSSDDLLVTKSFERFLRSQVSWEVETYENNLFRGWTFQDFQTTFSGDTSSPQLTTADDLPGVLQKDLPEHFDSREKWGHCVHPIRTQGKCGSCWAFGTTEAISDRFCIKGKDVILSPQDLVSCDKSNHACGGGRPCPRLSWKQVHSRRPRMDKISLSGREHKIDQNNRRNEGRNL